MDKSFKLLGVRLQYVLLLVGFLYFFGRWSWLTNALFVFGLFVAGIVSYAVYTHFLRGVVEDGSPRSIPLSRLKTPVSTFGLFSSTSADSQFLLAKEQTWTEFRKARAMERIRQRPPQLMSSRPQAFRPKSNVSQSSEDFFHSSISGAFQQQTPIPPQIISRFQGVIGDVIGFVNRDFVLSWYKKLSPEPVVGHRVESMMFHMALEMTRRLERLDMVQIIVSKLLPAFTQHVREYRKAERLFSAERLQRPNGQDPEELDFLFARCYKGGNMHPAIPTSQGPSQISEQSYLRNAVKPIVPSLLPKNERTGRIMTVMAREMIVCKVLQPMMDSLAEPDTWNMMFESLVEKMIGQDIALAKKINEAVERQDSEDDGAAENPDAIVRPPSFEEYIKLIKNCDNLLDALRIRERINSEIMKKRTEVAGLGGEDLVNGIRVSEVRLYIDRLLVAQKRIDKRIKALGGKSLKISVAEPTIQKDPKAILEVLESPHLLSAFSEFMDKEGHLSSLQFWMTAAGIERQIETLELHDGNSWLAEPDSVIIDDACKLFHNFFRKNSVFIELEDDLFRDLAACFERLDVKDPTEIQSLRWLKLIKKAKDAVLSQMETEYLGFIQSSVYKSLQTERGRDHHANERGHFPDDYSIYSGDGSPRKSNDSLRSRNSSDGEEERSRKPFKLANMFKMKKKDVWGSDEMSQFPSRKDGSDNVEGELKSILNADERVNEKSFFAKRTLSRTRKDKSKEGRGKDDGYLSSDYEKSPGFFKGFSRHKKSASTSSKKDLSPNPKATTLDRTSPRAKEVSVSKDSLKAPLSESDDSGSENVLSTLTRFRDELSPRGMHSDVPIVLYPPQRVLELTEKCGQLEKERKQLQNQMDILHQEDEAEAKKYRQLSLMQVGLDVELANLRAETVRVERDDLDHILTPERISVKIMEAKSVEGDEREGRHYTVYPVFVQRTNLNGPASAWTVERRYSEFELLNARLKGLYHWVSQIEFPGKMLKDLMQNKKLLVETRRKSLEKYLQTLLRNAEVCRTNEMKKFLCHEDILRKMHGPLEALGDGVHKKSFMKNIMQVVESPFDFMNRLKNANMNSTDMLPDTLGSDGTPELLLTTTLGRNKSPESRPERILVDPTLNSGLNSWSVYPGQSGALTGPGSIRDPGIPSVSATDAAIDLFIELFELKEKNNWLRRQATVILLQQLFGGTVERKVTENLAYLGELECTVNLLEWARDYFWPGKAPFHETVRPIRTPEQKKKSKADAQGKMVHLFPELLGGLVGRHNAKRGAERLCAVFQNRRLNQQLIYIVLDELMGTAFPELRRN